MKSFYRLNGAARQSQFCKASQCLVAALVLFSAPMSYAARDAAQLLEQQRENRAVALREKNDVEKNPSSECSAKSLHLPLDHGPHAATTASMNHQKIDDCRAEKLHHQD